MKEKTQYTEKSIFRIDGNICHNEPISGLMGYYGTKELAEIYLKEQGCYLETRKWEHISEHKEGTENYMWYNKKLDENGCSYDDTSYAFITEVKVKYPKLKEFNLPDCDNECKLCDKKNTCDYKCAYCYCGECSNINLCEGCKVIGCGGCDIINNTQ